MNRIGERHGLTPLDETENNPGGEGSTLGDELYGDAEVKIRNGSEPGEFPPTFREIVGSTEFTIKKFKKENPESTDKEIAEFIRALRAGYYQED